MKFKCSVNSAVGKYKSVFIQASAYDCSWKWLLPTCPMGCVLAKCSRNTHGFSSTTERERSREIKYVSKCRQWTVSQVHVAILGYADQPRVHVSTWRCCLDVVGVSMWAYQIVRHRLTVLTAVILDVSVTGSVLTAALEYLLCNVMSCNGESRSSLLWRQESSGCGFDGWMPWWGGIDKTGVLNNCTELPLDQITVFQDFNLV